MFLLIFYWTFCVFAGLTFVQEDKKYTFWTALWTVICVMIISPIAFPMILGIKVGGKLKEE